MCWAWRAAVSRERRRISVGLLPGVDVDVVLRVGLPCVPSGLHNVLDIVLGVPAHLLVDRFGEPIRCGGSPARRPMTVSLNGRPVTFLTSSTIWRTGGALAGADVERVILALVAVQILQRGDMRVGQIGHVDVVAHAGAVRSRVVVAEDRRALPFFRRSNSIGMRFRIAGSSSSTGPQPATLK